METTETDLGRLRARLEARARELAEEVSRYPSPIARCDDQLPGLIEARTRTLALVRRAAELEREKAHLPQAEWRARFGELAAEAERLW